MAGSENLFNPEVQAIIQAGMEPAKFEKLIHHMGKITTQRGNAPAQLQAWTKEEKPFNLLEFTTLANEATVILMKWARNNGHQAPAEQENLY